ncbi:50S ribosomal protein L23 [bacterium]|nr:50S ribosomal protein L23 [bacterium]
MLTSDDLNRYRSIILQPIVTEKSMQEADELRKYHFRVHSDANKIEIRAAVEALFNVKVTDVNTMNVLGKARRRSYRYRQGRTARWKKAIVTLAPGNTISVVETG